MNTSAAHAVRTFEYTREVSGHHAPEAAQEKRRILVVDDDPMIRRFILEALGERYRVLAVSNGLELTRLMGEFKPDLVLLDVMMPWIDGLQLCRTIKTHPDWTKTPVIFVSGRKSPADVQRGLRQGASAYLTKPFRLVELYEKIGSLLGERENELV